MAEEKKVRKASSAKTSKTTKAKKPAAKKTATTKIPSVKTKAEIFTAGDRQCYCYVSINLTSNTRHGSIISIGAMAPDGETFYAESTDYNMKDVTPAVFENVIKYLVGNNDQYFNTIVAPLGEIRDKFIEWLKSIYEPKGRFVQFVMDKVEWDWPIFKEFIAPEGVDYPTWMSPVVADLNGDLANAISVSNSNIDAAIKGEDSFKNFISHMLADHGVERNETAESIGNVIGIVMVANDANALKKAMVTRSIHQSLWGYDKVIIKETPETKEEVSNG